jgi:hypothetical protein
MRSTDGGAGIPRRAGRNREINRLIAQLARRQHGVVARRQLIEAGIDPRSVTRRVSSGQLQVVFRGVFAMAGSPLTERGRWMAAVLTCGDGAVLSHITAACAWGICAHQGVIHVARVSGSRGGPPGICLHHPRRLPEHEIARTGAIPLTSVPRTLVDLAGMRNPELLLDAFSASRRLRLLNVNACWRCILDAPMRPGVLALARLLDQFEPFDTPSLSELQDRVLKLCLDAGLPAPEIEVPLGSRRVDFLWRDEKVILEVDGRAFHEDQFDEDRDRDLDHAAMGYLTVRVTYRMIRERPGEVVDRLRRVLASRRPSRAPQRVPLESRMRRGSKGVA